VLSRYRKTFVVSSLVLNLLASQIGEFFLPHPVLFHTPGREKGCPVACQAGTKAWVGSQRHDSAPLPQPKRAGTHCTGVWVGLGVYMDGSGKSRTHLGSKPGPSRLERETW